MPINNGDTIEYLSDVTAPPGQAGQKGEQKEVAAITAPTPGKISKFAARLLAKDGKVKKVDNPKSERKANVRASIPQGNTRGDGSAAASV